MTSLPGTKGGPSPQPPLLPYRQDTARRTDIHRVHSTKRKARWCASQHPGSGEAKVILTGQFRFYVPLACAADVNGSEGGGDTAASLKDPRQDGHGHLVSLPRVTVSIEAFRKELFLHVGEHPYTVPQVTSRGLVTNTVELSTEHIRIFEAGELENPGRQSGDDGELRQNRTVSRDGVFLVRDFLLGHRPHKAILEVVGHEAVSPRGNSDSSRLWAQVVMWSAHVSGVFGVQGDPVL